MKNIPGDLKSPVFPSDIQKKKKSKELKYAIL